jgi:hypothetical protein
MRQPGQREETIEERDARGYAAAEQLCSRDGLLHYKPLLLAALPALAEVGLELAHQAGGELSTAEEREAMAARAGEAVRQALLGILQVPTQGPPAKGPGSFLGGGDRK